LKEAVVLGVGIDWAESFHDVAIGRPGEGVIEQFRFDHGPAGVQRLAARCLELEPDPAEVRVVLETRHGLLVEALIDAGFTVLPVNPDLVARRRGPAKKKDDSEDARICCLMALDAYLDLRQLIPHGEAGTELRAIARDDERAARGERRIGNRLRADLLAVFPAAVDIADGDLGAPVFLKLLERWPSAAALSRAGRDEIEAFARSARHGWPGRFADQVTVAVAAPRLAPRPALARAKEGSIRLAAAQLPAIRAQRRAWERRMGELLPGAPRYGRSKTPKDPDPGKAFPGGEIYLSMPGLGDRLAARVAGEIGEHFGQFAAPNALQCYPGRAPVTRRSGRSEFTIARRLACNRHLGEAVQQWAFCSLSRSAWASEFYDEKTAAGDSHHAALRKLGCRWLEVLWHCLHKGARYDEAIHAANRNRNRSRPPAAAA
jgi:Transposase/Transposase IS116/IS110/IS902 family